jgi:hypothetical protein
VTKFVEDNWLKGERLGSGSFDATTGSIMARRRGSDSDAGSSMTAGPGIASPDVFNGITGSGLNSRARSIVIFSDGTGQRGGVYFDEARMNVYKLFRATRVIGFSVTMPADPESEIDSGQMEVRLPSCAQQSRNQHDPKVGLTLTPASSQRLVE